MLAAKTHESQFGKVLAEYKDSAENCKQLQQEKWGFLCQFKFFVSSLASTLQGWQGASVVQQAQRPASLCSCTTWKAVPIADWCAEALTAQGLDVEIKPAGRWEAIPPEAQRRRRQAAISIADRPNQRRGDV